MGRAFCKQAFMLLIPTCIFTRDGEAARYFTDNIKVGMVDVNVALPVPVAIHRFGG
jgi:malonate-semialdehyde dehydrogenase (acetylating)/methylmalonate-semialdehyde dehydrogenase